MFRKLVSSLPFSPALVGQLGFYARRLRREQSTRRLGLILTALALVVQSFVLFNPPEPTYARAPSSDCAYTNTLAQSDPDCRACPSNTNLWVNDPACNKNLRLSIAVVNLTHSGKNITASPSDRIQYTIRTTNTSLSTKVVTPIELSMKDVLEYTTITDAGGGTYDPHSQKLAWGTVTLAAGQSDLRSFVLSVNDPLPATPQAVDDPSSYDCELTMSYGTTLNNALSCPVGKKVESVVKRLPETGVGAPTVFSVALLGVVTYLYLRTRLLNREMQLIRRDFNVG